MSKNPRSNFDLKLTGFILQKDVYTTNLLYSYNLFPLKSLRKRLPFRNPHPENEISKNYSVNILRKNENNTPNFDISKNYLDFIKKPKIRNLKKLKLKFPMPKGKIMSLNNLIFYQEMSDKNIRIKNIDDDSNITSNNGKKILYKFKDTKHTKMQPMLPLIPLNTFKQVSKKERNKSMSLSNERLKNMIENLNDEMKNIKIFEAKRRKIRDKFFNTQIYVNNILK